MGVEIERKFLLCGDDWRTGAVGEYCRQAYICRDTGCLVRVRVIGSRACLTIKGNQRGCCRSEYEFAIPVAEAERILDEFGNTGIIEKIRYEVTWAGARWDIDEFLGRNAGLIVAEIELESENAGFELPGWIDREVSDDPRYLNVNLAQRPFEEWSPGSEN